MQVWELFAYSYNILLVYIITTNCMNLCVTVHLHASNT